MQRDREGRSGTSPIVPSVSKHVRAAELAESSPAAFAMCAIIVLAVVLGISVGWWLGLLVGLPALLVVSHICEQRKRELLSLAERMRSDTCTCLKRAVHYVRWQSTHHHFEV